MMTVTIERNLKLRKGEPFDGLLVMEWEGATLDSVEKESSVYKAGLRVKDLLTGIDGKALRYTPLRIVSGKLDKKDNDRIITVQRKLDVIRTE